jgi:hypothetical protein
MIFFYNLHCFLHEFTLSRLVHLLINLAILLVRTLAFGLLLLQVVLGVFRFVGLVGLQAV